MAPFGKKSDKQWRFVGHEVTRIEDLTLSHIRSVYGLGCKNQEQDNAKEPSGQVSMEESSESIFPYCSNRYFDSPPLSPSSVKGHGTCSAARCKDGNPHCLNYLGQEQWEKDDSMENYFATVARKPNPRLLKRPEGTPSGMKNLGATCYANSLLQVWFHDLAFRDAIYRCQFRDDIAFSTDALYQLQLLFVHLDRGLKSFYNPLSLVNSLKLDTAMQQDAQEFCNLFMARIDTQLQKQQDPQLGDFIKSQFLGHYSYNTTCKNCKKTSKRDCQFYELMLNIKDNCTLMDCLEEFVEPEDLVGADQYSCSICGSLQDASREIKLDKLPNVLNIQLMRFVYDSVTWTKKKSKDTIRFPETIDFSELLGLGESVVYELSAVLVHSGPSAHSGHFMAHVLDRESNKWFVLNDEEVSEFHGTKFDLEDYSESASSAKTKKSAAKSTGSNAEKNLSILSSRNAYMLTYTKRCPEPAFKPCAPPAKTLAIAMQDNSDFMNELEEYAQYKEGIEKNFKKARDERRELYQCWHVSCDQDNGYYVSAEALSNFIQFQDEIPLTLDNSNLCCEHGKLCPTGVLKSKRISKTAGKLLEDRWQIKMTPSLTSEDICLTCARDLFQDKLYSFIHRRDVEEFERKAKGVRSPAAVWISKPWIADWVKVSPRLHTAQGTTADDPSPVSMAYLPDVLCPHSGLSSDKTKRKLINRAALEVLTRIFGEMPLPDSEAVECLVCRDQLQPKLDDLKDLAARAASEKSELSDMIMRGARVRHMKPGEKYYVIAQDFMKIWLDFIKRPMVNKRPTEIDNTCLLCKHGQFTFDLDNIIDVENEDEIAVIKEEEWAYLHATYEGGPEITVTRTEVMQPDHVQTNLRSVAESVPSLCSSCRNERILDFSSTTLIIRVFSPGEAGVEGNDSIAPSDSGSEKVPDIQDSGSSKKSSTNKRKKQALSTPTLEIGSRRSKRSKATKKPYKEIKIPVSKWETVMGLKLKIMQKTDIVPLYQKLVHEKVELDKNETTIADLEIPPNAVLDLIAFDQRIDDLTLSSLQDFPPMPGDEGGFGGTGLAEDWL
ncbi:hypothetical protein EDD21DRAFT_364219 [Dissophora ornata]|nr:hypothetical protein EDD21DRAFT_364219 [Dissophora ornata]